MGYVVKLTAVVGIAAIVGLSFSPSILEVGQKIEAADQRLASPTEYLQNNT